MFECLKFSSKQSSAWEKKNLADKSNNPVLYQFASQIWQQLQHGI